MNKSKILDFAESFDALRIVPRIILFGYAGWLAYLTDRLLTWYMALPAAAQTTQASGFCLGAIGSLTTIGGFVYRIYANTGRSWDNQATVRTSSTTVEQTVK
jgi:hypothetical protein